MVYGSSPALCCTAVAAAFQCSPTNIRSLPDHRIGSSRLSFKRSREIRPLGRCVENDGNCPAPSRRLRHRVSRSRSSFDDEDHEDEEEFLRREIAHLEQLEEMMGEFDELDMDEDSAECDVSDQRIAEEEDNLLWDENSLTELLGSIQDDNDEEDVSEDVTKAEAPEKKDTFASLENALMQGVVPVSAGVGTDCLPGDFGFDPLNLSTKDYFRTTQRFLMKLVPGGNGEYASSSETIPSRPRALILRDYREAEIRHSRLAMLAALFWPLQEMLDRFFLNEDQYGPLIYGPVTLPYFPLLMTAIMLLLGYLDIYSQAIKDMDKIGEAYLPGDCFWDPLRMLEGAPDVMKRRMQERELFNGRAAMLAVVVFIWEEAISHRAVIDIEGNELLFEPAYQIPFIQNWLDAQFSSTDPDVMFFTPVTDGSLDTVGSLAEP